MRHLAADISFGILVLKVSVWAEVSHDFNIYILDKYMWLHTSISLCQVDIESNHLSWDIRQMFNNRHRKRVPWYIICLHSLVSHVCCHTRFHTSGWALSAGPHRHGCHVPKSVVPGSVGPVGGSPSWIAGVTWLLFNTHKHTHYKTNQVVPGSFRGEKLVDALMRASAK